MMVIVAFFLFLFNQVQIINGYDCYHRCDADSYCCRDNQCCPLSTSYAFFSMWYFWFIVALLILSCAASCGYYRRRRRLLALQRQMPATVVMFNTNRQHAPTQPGMPPTYLEATNKPNICPPPYYTVDATANQQFAPYVQAQVPPAGYPPPYGGPPAEPRVFLPSMQK